MSYRSQVLTIFSFFLIAIAAPSRVHARIYGGGTYGSGIYGGEDIPVHVDSGSLPIPEAGCTSPPPGSAPWLYGAIAKDAHSILLYFTDSADPVDRYVLQYGSAMNDYPFGSSNIGSKGARTYLVEALAANTTYHFRVSGANGCANGPWSNDIAAKTSGSILQASVRPQLAVKSITLQPEPTIPEPSLIATPSATLLPTEVRYELTVHVVDTDQKAVKDVTVTLNDSPQIHVTDENGGVTFAQLQSGDYTVTISYQGRSAESHIYLSGIETARELTVVIEKPEIKKNINWPLLAVVGVFTLGVLGGLIFFFKKRV